MAGVVVHIVDDDLAVRRSLKRLLLASGFEARVYDGPDSILDATPELTDGCILLDLEMPRVSGAEVMERLNARAVKLPIIIMTGLGDGNLVLEAIRMGATCILEKPFSETGLFSAISASGGGAMRPAGALDGEAALAVAEADAAISRLSRREREVLMLLADGQPQKTIAHELGISARTVEVHRSRMLRRLGTRRLATAIRILALAELGSTDGSHPLSRATPGAPPAEAVQSVDRPSR